MSIFSKATETQVTKAIIDKFYQDFQNYLETEVIVVGGGPSGLTCAKELAQEGVKTLIIESNNYLGGGFWIGGYLMNGLTVRRPGEEILEEFQIPYQEVDNGLYVANGPQACSKLIAGACDAGVRVLNMTKFDDVVIRDNNKVSGVVINWTPVDALPRALTCVDPIGLEAKLVVDATGHDAVVVNSLVKRDILKVPGFNPMWVQKSEDLVVQKTGLIHPGLIVTGMAVATSYGLPRMGPTFGGMLLSGKKAAEEILKLLSKEKITVEI